MSTTAKKNSSHSRSGGEFHDFTPLDLALEEIPSVDVAVHQDWIAQKNAAGHTRRAERESDLPVRISVDRRGVVVLSPPEVDVYVVMKKLCRAVIANEARCAGELLLDGLPLIENRRRLSQHGLKFDFYLETRWADEAPGRRPGTEGEELYRSFGKSIRCLGIGSSGDPCVEAEPGSPMTILPPADQGHLGKHRR